MIIHPDTLWINEIINNVFNTQWRRKNLESIVESLPHYVSAVEYVIQATAILNACFDDLIVASRFDELVVLYETALSTMDSDQKIPPQSPANKRTKDNLHDTNAQQFPDEYFELRYYLAQVYLKQRQADKTIGQLQKLLDLMPTTNPVNQLRAYCFLLDFHSYGYTLEYDFDPVKITLQLADLYPQLKLKVEISVGHYHYSRGDTKELENSIRRINKFIPQATRSGTLDATKINEITAEQHFYLAIMYIELKQFDKAETNLDIASKRYVRVNNTLQNMLVLYETSQLYMETEEYEKALQWNELAFREYYQMSVQDPFYKAMLEHGQALVHFNMEKYKEALPLFESALPVWKQFKHEYHTALALNAVGVTKHRLNRSDQALPHLEEAHEICSKLTDKQYAQDLLKLINKNIKDANNRLS